MNIEYLIQILNNKMTVLSNAKSQAFMTGDLATVNQVEADMASVADTIYKLQLLLQVSQDTSVTNAALAAAMQIKTSITINGSTDVLNNYDLSTYAADPLYLQKITDILSAMGPMTGPDVIDAYISTEAIGSPITGQMIQSSAGTYSVDVRLLMAILELESNFGTAGVGAQTFNPGNVGNTGSSTQTYNSWQDGVSAVAEWLSLHPATNSTATAPDNSTTTTTDATTTAATNTIATTTSATSTSTIPFTITAVPATGTASTTPTTATSTDPTTGGTATSTTATSTDPTSGGGTATTTLDFDPGNLGGGTTTGTSTGTTTTATGSGTTSTSSTTPTTATSTNPAATGAGAATTTLDFDPGNLGGTTATSTGTTTGATGGGTVPGSATGTTTQPVIFSTTTPSTGFTDPTIGPPVTASSTPATASTTQAIRKLRVKSQNA